MMDGTNRMRAALDNIERSMRFGHADVTYIRAQIEFAKAPVHTTSDAVRAIKEATGCGFDTAFQAYTEGETVEAAIHLVRSARGE